MREAVEDSLRVAQRVAKTASEGPGLRYALWVQGCSIRCAGCCNPEMFAARGGELLAIDGLAREVLGTVGIEGLTVLGGEPFEQAGPVAELAKAVRAGGLSVMVFTGFVREDLETKGDAATAALLAATDLLVDGPFVQQAPGSAWRWLGSLNQRMHFMTDRYRADDPRFRSANTLDIRIERGRVEVSGWAPAAIELMRHKRPR